MPIEDAASMEGGYIAPESQSIILLILGFIIKLTFAQTLGLSALLALLIASPLLINQVNFGSIATDTSIAIGFFKNSPQHLSIKFQLGNLFSTSGASNDGSGSSNDGSSNGSSNNNGGGQRPGAGGSAVVGGAVTFGDQVRSMGRLVRHPGVVVDWTRTTRHGLERMLERGVSRNMIDLWVRTGQVLEQSNGKFAFITQQGVAIVSRHGELITTWSSRDFNNEMLEVIRILFGN